MACDLPADVADPVSLAGTWLGHLIDALLTDVPIGALTLVIILDGQLHAA